MPEPIVEQIAANIETALLTVTIANGYQVDIAGVVRPAQFALETVSPKNLLAVIMQTDAMIDDSKHLPTVHNPDGRNLVHWIQPFAISLFIQTSEKADPIEPADKLINRFRASAEKALMQDLGWANEATPTVPLAYQSDVVYAELFEPADGGFVGVTIVLEVRYRTFEDDPYNQPAL